MQAPHVAFLAFIAWVAHAIRWRPVKGWEVLVREVRATDVWVSPEGYMGAPLEWSLLEPTMLSGEARLRAVREICRVSGDRIWGLNAGEGIVVDTVVHYKFGVRCARCHVPIRADLADMRISIDVPSCPWCRKQVRRVIRES